MRVEYVYTLDYSKGRTPLWRRFWGHCSGYKRTTIITIDLERNWKAARYAARKRRRSIFRTFVEDLIQTLDHETVHAFERAEYPHRWFSLGERGAETFAYAGGLVRRYR